MTDYGIKDLIAELPDINIVIDQKAVDNAVIGIALLFLAGIVVTCLLVHFIHVKN